MDVVSTSTPVGLSPATGRPADVLPGAVSGVSGTAIVAGTLVAVSTSLVLLALGAGFGFAALSPWPGTGASVAGFAVSTAIGLIVVQWISALLGGYITGRLRTRWINLHTHEVFFRDTAHGLVTWSAATLIVTGVVAIAASSGAGVAAHAVGSAAATAATAAPAAAQAYEVDTLLRPGSAQTPPVQPEVRAETTRIVTQGLVSGSLSDADRAYLAQTVSTQTGISAADAQTRIDGLIAKRKQAEVDARQAADTARKIAEQTSLFTGFAMLIGAFIASVSAAIGGRLRDLHL
jgi:hypothetical protein